MRDPDEKKINNRFGVQVVPRVLGSVPGITILADQGRPRASDVVGYWPALIDRDRVPMRVVVGDERGRRPLPSTWPPPRRPARLHPRPAPGPRRRAAAPTVKVPLARLCLARSGDKGDTCNVGVIARSEAIYGWMLEPSRRPS